MQQQLDDGRGTLDLVRCHTAIGDPYFEKSRRSGRMLGLFLLLVLLVLSVYLFLHTQQFLSQVQTRVQGGMNTDSARIRQYNRQIEALEEKMSVFIADSLENRLHSLEKSVADGKVGDQEIQAIETLKNELRMLEVYSAGKGGHLIDPLRLDHPRLQRTPGSEQVASGDDQLLDDLMQIKHLLYLSIASCGTVGLLLGGYCWKYTLRSRRFQSAPRRASLTGPPSRANR